MASYTITGFILDDDNLNFKDTTYGNATASEDGLMSSTDKERLEDAIQDITTMGGQISDLQSTDAKWTRSGQAQSFGVWTNDSNLAQLSIAGTNKVFNIQIRADGTLVGSVTDA